MISARAGVLAVVLLLSLVLLLAPTSGYSGAAYLFDAATGDFLLTLTNPMPGADHYFGTVVAFAGGHVLVGVPSDDTGASKAGSAYLFDGTTGG
jgi:expansin (peptidoglycan-binding protein)